MRSLFPTARIPSRSRELRGGQSIPLRLSVDTSNAVLQLSAERLALNLRDAGWNVRVVPHGRESERGTVTCACVHVEAADAAAALRETMQDFGAALRGGDARIQRRLYAAERAFLQSHTVVPLLYLPRAYGVSSSRAQPGAESRRHAAVWPMYRLEDIR